MAVPDRRKALSAALSLACALASMPASADTPGPAPASADPPGGATEPPATPASAAAAAAALAALRGYRNSLSVSLFSFFGPGVTVEYERFAFPPALSLVNALGFRTTGGSDYTTTTFTASFEARVWPFNIGSLRTADSGPMTGPLLSFREDLAWTSVQDNRRDHLAGTAVEIAETLGVGYRLTLWRLHATPILGGTVTTQVDPRGRIASATFMSGKLAITLGILF